MPTGGRNVNADIVTIAMQAKRMTNVSLVVPGFLHAISGLSELRSLTSDDTDIVEPTLQMAPETVIR
jgi:hypothetical protein